MLEEKTGFWATCFETEGNVFDLFAWIKENKPLLEKQLVESRRTLLRNFNISSVSSMLKA